MHTTTETDFLALEAESTAAEALELRTIENAELIHVGGGYCAADY